MPVQRCELGGDGLIQGAGPPWELMGPSFVSSGQRHEAS